MGTALTVFIPFLLGGATGLLLGLTGAGGGILASPLLILVLHQSVRDSAPISLVAVVVGAGLGALMGLRQGIVRYRAALLLSLSGVIGSPVGIYLARRIPNAPLILAFSCLLFYQAWRYWQPSVTHQDSQLPCRLGATGRFQWDGACFWTMVRMGGETGFLSGLLGVGGGFVLVPALRRHTPLDMHSVTATSLMVLTLVSLGGLVQWMALGQIHWGLAEPFLGGVISGMVVGRSQLKRLSENHMRRVFSLLCFAVAAGLLVKTAGLIL